MARSTPTMPISVKEAAAYLKTEKELENSNQLAILTAEESVKKYFSDTPELIEVARCESRFRHYDKKGQVLRGKVNNNDIGVMQVNTYYHETQAKKLGLDLFDMEDNMEYALYLYMREGLMPWNSSSKCWRGTVYELALAR